MQSNALKTMGKSVVMLGVVLSALTLTACNTMSGLGRDVESAGDAVEDTAEDAQN